ncbi:MAG: translation initiation factor IF-1 [Candidatus Dormibacteraeota bacterium]|nr:translation initiation factor IF-1 [Candidatus Dormibacteraeota bacterium]
MGYTLSGLNLVWFRAPFTVIDPGQVQGRVLESLPNSLYRVELAGGAKVVAHAVGRARLASVRLLPGDRVVIEVSATDPGRGRILARVV